VAGCTLSCVALLIACVWQRGAIRRQRAQLAAARAALAGSDRSNKRTWLWLVRAQALVSALRGALTASQNERAGLRGALASSEARAGKLERAHAKTEARLADTAHTVMELHSQVAAQETDKCALQAR
jgi:hypothetical protein